MIVFCFLVSGVTAVVIETVWLRTLALSFGHTVSAVTAVFAAILAGLGLGSLLIGRLADRRSDRVLIYGVLACAVGVWSALVPALLPMAARALPGPSATLAPVQFVFAFLLLLPATAGMGAMLPLLARAVTRDEATIARDVGSLYAAHAFGAALGAAAAGYALLPALGATATLRAAAAASIVIGLVAMLIGRLRREVAGGAAARSSGSASADARRKATPESIEASRQRGESVPPPPAQGIAVLAAIGLSGAAAMICVLAWARVLTLVIGGSTYALTAVLVAVLAGIAIGAALFARLPAPGSPRPETLAALLAAAAVGALAMIPTFDRFPGLVARAFGLSTDPGFVLVVQLVMSALVTLGPTLLIGAVFPCAVGLVARDRGRTGRDVARFFATATAGAIVGAGLAGLVLIPGVGVLGAVKAGVLLHLVAAAVVLAGSFATLPRWHRAAALALAVAVVAGVLLSPSWDRSVMASGVAVYGSDYGRLIDKLSIADFMRSRRLLFYEDGPTATVTVHESTHRLLRADGKTEASNGPDMHTQLLLGHLPLLAHPDPRRVLVIGLGTGVTAAAVARHPVERIDVVEIEPAMTRAARWFERENRAVLADSRFRLSVADARAVLRTRADRYDVIISAASSPWVRGASALFTSEFYALAGARLASGGLMVQWVQASALAPADLKTMVATFRRAFPATTTWSAARGDYLLLGSATSHPVRLEPVAARYAANPGLREDFERVGLIAAPALFADLVLDEAETARFAEGAAASTDDRLPLELSGPWSLSRDTADENRRLLRRFRVADLPPPLDRVEARYAIGVAYLAKGLPDEGLAAFNRALARDPGHVPSLLERGRVLRYRGETAEALASLEAAARRAPKSAEIQYEIGLARQAQGGPAAALPAYARAVALAPARADYMRGYAAALAQAGHAREALAYLLLARALRPRDPALMDLAAFIYLQLGNTARAVELLQEAVAAAPEEAIYHFRLGQAQMQNKNQEAAIAGLRRATELRPDFVEAHLELANTYLAAEQLGPAIAEYRRVVALDPRNAMALRILTLLQR